ncbi:hypothetical protein BDR05DRAFT_968873 [Suillus weaverae]|nr:hypothetical protein BDR05DRAFT_968873 [Suillus weaverae]
MRHIHARILGYLQSLDVCLTRGYEGDSGGSTVGRFFPSDLFDPISHPHTQCVKFSPLQLPSLSLLLWHHQTLPHPLTVALRNVPLVRERSSMQHLLGMEGRLFMPSESKSCFCFHTDSVVHGTDARVTSSWLLSLSCSVKDYRFPAKKEVVTWSQDSD